MKEKRSEKKQRVAEKPKHADEKAPKEKKPTDKLADKSGLTIFLQHIFGDAQKKTLRRLEKRVAEINKLAPKYADMSNKELQEQTEKLKKRLEKAQKQVIAAKALEKAKNRLVVYQEQTAPVAKYYEEQGTIFTTLLSESANRLKNEVAADVIEYLDNKE